MQAPVDPVPPPAIVVAVDQPASPSQALSLMAEPAQGIPMLAAVTLPKRSMSEGLITLVKLIDEAFELIEGGRALCHKYSSQMEWAGVAKVAINAKRPFQSETNARIGRLRCDLINIAVDALPEIAANLYSESLLLRTIKGQILSTNNPPSSVLQMVQEKVEDLRQLRELASGKMKLQDMLKLTDQEVIIYLVKAHPLAPKATPKIAAALASFAADIRGLRGEKRSAYLKELTEKVQQRCPELAKNMRPLLERH